MIGTIVAGAAGVALAPALGALAYREVRRRRVARELALAGPEAIDERRFVRLGGIEQWITIRGERRDNPVVLVVHGGPGYPFACFTPIMRPWERHFTFVQWDQRGAGKTFGRNGAGGCGRLSFDRLAEDGLELAELLAARFGRRIVVLGGSMGNVIAARMVRRRPELVAAYVATDLGVDRRDEAESYRVTLARLRARGRSRAAAELAAIGPDPTRWSVREWQNKQRWVMRTDPRLVGVDGRLLVPALFTAPGYSLADVRAIVAGMELSARELLAEFMAHDERRAGTRFEAPFFLIQGAEDVLTTTASAAEFFADVAAPHKEMALIEEVGHFAAFLRPERFLAELLRRVRPRV